MEIEELRTRLAEIQNMDSIEDLTDEVLLANYPSNDLKVAQAGLELAENEDWAKDIDMALGMEADKTQELNESMDYQRREALEKEIDEIRANRIDAEDKLRKAWLQKQREQAKETRSQMQKEAKQAFFKEVKGIEADLQAQVQQNAENVSMQIETKNTTITKLQAEIAELEEERKSILAIVAENKAVLALKKEGTPVYQVAKRESKNCLEKARRRANKIKGMNAQIEGLQGEIKEIEQQGKTQETMLQEQLAGVGEILDAIYEERIERAEAERVVKLEAERAEAERVAKLEAEKAERLRQEDEMWKEYRKEQEEQKKQKSEDDKKFERKIKENEKATENQQDWEEHMMEAEADYLANESEELDGLNPEEQAIKPTGQKPQGTVTPPQSAGQKPVPPTEKWKIEKALFTIENGNVPVYKVIISNGKEQKEVTSNEIVLLDKKQDSNTIEMLKNKAEIYEADKYYDKGLAKVLERVDILYGTQGLKEYITLLKDRELLHKEPEKYEDLISIDYDFSQLNGKPSAEIKKLQALAKRCGEKEISDYEKAPNIFQRIWRRLTQRKLEPNMSKEEMDKEVLKNRMEDGLENRSFGEDIYELAEYPEFSPEVAEEQLESCEGRRISEVCDAKSAISDAKKWRAEQHIETTRVDVDNLPKTPDQEKDEHEID